MARPPWLPQQVVLSAVTNIDRGPAIRGQFQYFEDEQRLITGRYAETGAQATTRYGILQYNLNGVPTSASFEFEETRGLLTLTINNERVTLVGR